MLCVCVCVCVCVCCVCACVLCVCVCVCARTCVCVSTQVYVPYVLSQAVLLRSPICYNKISPIAEEDIQMLLSPDLCTFTSHA